MSGIEIVIYYISIIYIYLCVKCNRKYYELLSHTVTSLSHQNPHWNEYLLNIMYKIISLLYTYVLLLYVYTYTHLRPLNNDTHCYVEAYLLLMILTAMYIFTNCYVYVYKLLCICLQTAMYMSTNCYVYAYKLLCICLQTTMYMPPNC